MNREDYIILWCFACTLFIVIPYILSLSYTIVWANYFCSFALVLGVACPSS